MATIGLSEAARLTGKPKSTIHRAMLAGRLRFEVGEDGTRLIDPADLGKVYPLQQARNSAPETADAPEKLIGNGRVRLGATDREMIYRGCTVAQLAEIFGMRDVTVFRRIAGIEPSGTGHGGGLIYRIAEVAPRLIQFQVTEEMVRQHLARMRPQDLPPGLHRAYWDGKLAQQRYAEKSGELWPTDDVMAGVSLAFQTLRQGLLLLPDQLRSEVDLNEAQTIVAQRIVDELIEALRERLITDFESGKHRRGGGGSDIQVGQA